MYEPTYHHVARYPIEGPDGRGVRLALSGELDLAAHDAVRDGIDAALGGPVEYVVLDLDHVTFLDCSGIRALLAGRRTAVRLGRRLEVINAHGLVRRILELTGAFDELAAPSLAAPAG
jgi:anti-sigma B factor antagonist